MSRPWFALVAGLLAISCRSPTQITFNITTNVDCSQLEDTDFTSGPIAALTDGRPPTAVTKGCAAAGRIGSVVVVPSGAADDLVAVNVTTGVGVEPDACGPTTKCIVAKRALRFVPDTPLVVNVDMSTACEGIVCDGDQTCEEGQCVSSLIPDPSQCEGNGCGGDVLDGGGVVPDATVGDAGGDATVTDTGAPDVVAEAALPGDAATNDASVPLDASVPSAITVAVGLQTSCALMPDGTVQCWGANAYGGLGDDASVDAVAYVPQPVPGLADVTSLSVGEAHACVVVRGGTVWCWGYNGGGQLGTAIGDETAAYPTLLQTLQYLDGGAMRSVAAGQSHTCAVGADGVSIWCWGIYDSYYGDNGSDTPVFLATLDAGVTKIAAGFAVTCAIDLAGGVWCWGQNNNGVLGLGDAAVPDASILTPQRVDVGEKAIDLAVSGTQVCVVTASHGISCWGDDSEDEFGTLMPPTGSSFLAAPQAMPLGPYAGRALEVGGGNDHECGLFEEAGVRCWGASEEGELGNGQDPQTDPTAVPNLGPAVELFVNQETSCARLVDGGIACWGNDDNGQLGAVVSPAPPAGSYPIGAFPLTFAP